MKKHMDKEGKLVKLQGNAGSTKVEKLRTYAGLEEISDEQAKQVNDTLQRFARITFKFYREWKEKEQQPTRQAA